MPVEHITVMTVEEILRLINFSSGIAFRDEFAKCGDPCDKEGWATEPELLEILYCLTRAIRPHTVVEIGTYRGGSAKIFAQALSANGFGKIYTIDDNSAGMASEARASLDISDVGEHVVFIEKSSLEAFEDWGRARVDILYIDGSHNFCDVCCDFALWARYVVPEGIIVIHDTFTRLLRRFPEDYIHPLDVYAVLNVVDMVERPSRHEWEGAAFIRRI